MVRHLPTQLSERLDVQRRGRLPIHVKVAPHGDVLASLDRTRQALYRHLQVRQRLGWCRCVCGWVEETPRLARLLDPAPGQQFGDERAASRRSCHLVHDPAQRIGHLDRLGIDPLDHHLLLNSVTPL